MEYLRKSFVCKNQIKKGLTGVKESLEYMKKGYSIALMVDQRVSEGPRINFFNSGAHTTTLPAQLSYRFGCDIVQFIFLEIKEDKFQMEMLDPVKFSESEKETKN